MYKSECIQNFGKVVKESSTQCLQDKTCSPIIFETDFASRPRDRPQDLPNAKTTVFQLSYGRSVHYQNHTLMYLFTISKKENPSFENMSYITF